MPIITISRGAYSGGKEVAEKVAEKLGFECISQEVLIEASEQFNVPEIKLLRGLRDAPSILERFTFEKERYIAYIRSALLGHFQKDNVVYHGLAGHYFVKGVSHVLKVRIIGQMKDRVNLVMQREEIFEQAASAMEGIVSQDVAHPGKHRGLSKDKALRMLEESDEERRKWGLYLYGIDTHDSSLYDLVIHINRLAIDDVADMIGFTVGLPHFQATAESQQVVDDLLLAARVKANLIERYPRVNVAAREGFVHIGLEGGTAKEEKAIQDAVGQMPGIRKFEINLFPFTTPD